MKSIASRLKIPALVLALIAAMSCQAVSTSDASSAETETIRGISCAFSPFGDVWEISATREIYGMSIDNEEAEYAFYGDPESDGVFDRGGSGTFPEPVSTFPRGTSDALASNIDAAVTAADLEGDGREELVMFVRLAGGQNALVGIDPSNGDVQDIWRFGSSDSSLAIGAGKFFSGAREQVLMASLSETNLNVFMQRDSGSATDSQLFGSDNNFFGFMFDSSNPGRNAVADNRRNLDMAVGDFNGDGIDEAAILYVKASGGVRTKVVEYNPAAAAAGDFRLATVATDSDGGQDSNFVAIAAGDVDRDGNDEIVQLYDIPAFGNAGRMRLMIYDLVGSSLVLDRQIEIGSTVEIGDIAIGDTDNDFENDIVIAYEDSGDLRVDSIDLQVSNGSITGWSFHNRFESPESRHDRAENVIVEVDDFEDAGVDRIVVAFQDNGGTLDSLFLEDSTSVGAGMTRRIPEDTIDGNRRFVIDFLDLSSERPFMAVGDRDNDALLARYGPLADGGGACQESIDAIVNSVVFVPPHWQRIEQESGGAGQVAGAFIGDSETNTVDETKRLGTSTSHTITGYAGAGLDAGVASASVKATASRAYETGSSMTEGLTNGTTTTISTSANDDFLSVESTRYFCYNYQFERNGIPVDGAARACELQRFSGDADTQMERVVLDEWNADPARRYRRNERARLRWAPMDREWANLTQYNNTQAFLSSAAQSAANAIDNQDFTSAQTLGENAPWLMLDLGVDTFSRVSKVRIINDVFNNALAENLNNYSLFIGTEDFRGLPNDPEVLASHPSVTFAKIRQGQVFDTATVVTQNGDAPVLGRYVKLMIESDTSTSLGVGELQVFGPSHIDPDRFPVSVSDADPNDGRFAVEVYDPAIGGTKLISVPGTLLLDGTDTSEFNPPIWSGETLGPAGTTPAWSLSEFAGQSSERAESFSSTTSVGTEIDVEAGLIAKVQFGGGVEFSSGVTEEESRTVSVTNSFDIGGEVSGFPAGSNYPTECFYKAIPYYYRKTETSDFGFEHDFIVIDYIVPEGSLARGSGLLDQCRPRNQVPDDQRMLAHWKFDGNLEDSTGNGFDLSFQGTGDPVYSTGKRGEAIDLRDFDSYLNVSGALLDQLPGCSISAWINTASLTPGDPGDPCCNAIFAEEGFTAGALHFNLAMWTDPDSYEFVIAGSNLPRAPVDVQETNTWVNLFFTYDAATGQQALYRNGALVSEATRAGDGASCGSGLGITLGAWDSDSSTSGVNMTRYFDGQLDDIRVYGRPLTEAEVQTLVDAPPPTFDLAVESSGVDNVPVDAVPALAAGVTNYTIADLESGTTIELIAPESMGSLSFTGWSGCDATAGVPATRCDVVVDSNTTVVASYELIGFVLGVRSTGVQGVPIEGFPANTAGSTDYTVQAIPENTAVDLIAPATSGGLGFTGWIGCDFVLNEPGDNLLRVCSNLINSDRSVVATYDDTSDDIFRDNFEGNQPSLPPPPPPSR